MLSNVDLNEGEWDETPPPAELLGLQWQGPLVVLAHPLLPLHLLAHPRCAWWFGFGMRSVLVEIQRLVARWPGKMVKQLMAGWGARWGRSGNDWKSQLGSVVHAKTAASVVSAVRDAMNHTLWMLPATTRHRAAFDLAGSLVKLAPDAEGEVLRPLRLYLLGVPLEASW